MVHAQIDDGDTFFAGGRGAEWNEMSRERHDPDDTNSYPYSFIRWSGE